MPENQTLFGFVNRSNDPASLGQKIRTFFGQLQATGRAVKKRGLQLLFQPAQRAADPGGGLR